MEKNITKNDFILMSPRKVKKFLKDYNIDPKSPYSKGNIRGLLLEAYVMSIIIKLVKEKNYFNWIISPIRSKSKKILNKDNTICHSSNGEIIISREGHNYAEFDGLFSIDNKIILLEIKSVRQSSVQSYDKIEKRFFKFAHATHTKPELLLIGDIESKFHSKFMENDNKQFGINILKVRNFDYWYEDFIKNQEINMNNCEKNVKNLNCLTKAKWKNPQEVFPTVIPFRWLCKRIISDFTDENLNKLNFLANWNRNYRVIPKIPLGKMSKDVLKTEYFLKIAKKMREHPKSSKFVLNLKITPDALGLELILCISQGSKSVPRYSRFMFDFQNKTFNYIPRRLSSKSYYFWEAKSFVNSSNAPIITSEIFDCVMKNCQKFEESKKKQEIYDWINELQSFLGTFSLKKSKSKKKKPKK